MEDVDASRRIGEILVAEKVISQGSLDEFLAAAEKVGMGIGAYLVDRGVVSETQIAQAFGRQLSIPWVSLGHVDFRPEILERIPAALAERTGMIPVYLRQARREPDVLFLAVSDPTNEEALKEAASHAGISVRPMVAGLTDIRNAIRFCYGAPKNDREEKKPLRPPLPARVKMPSVATDFAPTPLAPAARPKQISVTNEAAPSEPKISAVPIRTKEHRSAEEDFRPTIPQLSTPTMSKKSRDGSPEIEIEVEIPGVGEKS